MKPFTAKFITSVNSADRFYVTDKPIVAISGKSNVGKSSLINMLGSNKKLAKTSDTPGRTRLINYFNFGEFVLADLPGYGYAKVSKEEKEKWGRLMDEFRHAEACARGFACGYKTSAHRGRYGYGRLSLSLRVAVYSRRDESGQAFPRER